MSAQPDRLYELNRILPTALPPSKPADYEVKVWQRRRKIRIGNEEHTLAEWCRIRGVTYSAAFQRLEQGLGIDVALTPGKLERKGARVSIKGEEMSIREASRRYGMSYATLNARLKAGYPIEVAIRMKPRTAAQVLREQLRTAQAEITRLRERVAELEHKR